MRLRAIFRFPAWTNKTEQTPGLACREVAEVNSSHLGEGDVGIPGKVQSYIRGNKVQEEIREVGGQPGGSQHTI